MLGEQAGNFARCLQLQLSELRWKLVARFCPTAGVSTDAVCRSSQTISGVRSPRETAGRRVELQQGASARKDTSKHQGLVFWAFHEQRAVFRREFILIAVHASLGSHLLHCRAFGSGV